MTINSKELYTGVISYLGIDSYQLKGFQSNVTVAVCNDPVGLLPNWMFRADMMSVILTGKRCFDVVYHRNDDAISSIVCTPMNEAIISLEERDSYAAHSFNRDLPNSTLALLAAGSITESLEIDHQQKNVAMKPLLGFFSIPEPGKNFIFPSKELIEGHRFHEMLASVAHVMRRDHHPAPSMGR